jgi:hypothetical protein
LKGGWLPDMPIRISPLERIRSVTGEDDELAFIVLQPAMAKKNSETSAIKERLMDMKRGLLAEGKIMGTEV